MKDRINAIEEQGIAALRQAQSFDQLENLRQQYLGKKGQLTEVLKGLGRLAPDERKEMGQLANQVKESLARTIEEQKQLLLEDASNFDRAPDLTLPGLRAASGAR